MDLEMATKMDQFWKKNWSKDPQTDVIAMYGVKPYSTARVRQQAKDMTCAAILDIPIAHAALLRNYRGPNPADVLLRLETVLGENWSKVLNFWARLDKLTYEDWVSISLQCEHNYRGMLLGQACDKLVEAASDDRPGEPLYDAFRSTVEAAESHVCLRYASVHGPLRNTKEVQKDLRLLTAASLIAGWCTLEIILLPSAKTFQRIFFSEEELK